MRWRQKRRRKIALKWLGEIADSAQWSIDAGDLDFDDVIYRARNAALTLLEIFEPDDHE